MSRADKQEYSCFNSLPNKALLQEKLITHQEENCSPPCLVLRPDFLLDLHSFVEHLPKFPRKENASRRHDLEHRGTNHVDRLKQNIFPVNFYRTHFSIGIIVFNITK